MNENRESAFTLIELLIVVAIIGILAAIAVPSFLNAQIRAKFAKVQSEQRSLRDAYLMYKLDTNGWPKHIDGDLAQHRFVTTPIAYLSSSIADPFFKPQMRDNSPEWGWFKGQYHLEPAFFWHLGQWPGLSLNEPAFWAQQQNVAFFVMSIGPDAVFEMQTPTATIQATALPAPETSFYL